MRRADAVGEEGRVGAVARCAQSFMRSRERAVAFLSAALACGCIVLSCDSVQGDAGADAEMQVLGAQFFRGGIPAANGGPSVALVSLQNTTIRIGTTEKPLGGALGSTAKSAAIGLAGDTGYWVVPAGAADVETPGLPTFNAVLDFSRTLGVGAHSLLIEAVDANGRFGPPNATAVNAIDPSEPTGNLIVSLTWDTESDLDLHVVDPNGIEIYKGNINSYVLPPPGSEPDATAYLSGGILDQDSNANCVIDGRRRENVTWAQAPPAGHYLVRVDTFSLCSAAYANWKVTATLFGKVVGVAVGESTDTDVQMPHDQGAGVLALQFDVP